MKFFDWLFGRGTAKAARSDDPAQDAPPPLRFPPKPPIAPVALARKPDTSDPPNETEGIDDWLDDDDRVLTTDPFVPAARDYRFIAIDVETANRDPGSICQIGLATVDHAGIVETFGVLVDPGVPFADFNVSIHDIDEEIVAGAPTFADAIAQLRPILEAHPLIQHSQFDEGAIAAACRLAGVAPLAARWHDSVRIARRAWPEHSGNGGHGLANLKAVLGLDFEHHNAIEDARAAAEVVLLAERHTGKTFTEILSARAAPKAYSKHVRATGAAEGALAGHVAVFTGALTISREEAATLAAAAGITVTTSVSRRTTMLVVGDQDLTALAGHTKRSTHRRAEDLIAEGATIAILGETAFLALLADPAAAPAPPAQAIRTEPKPRPPQVAPDALSEVVVMATGGILPDDLATRLAAEKGMMLMKNVTNRTTIVVVRWEELEVGAAKSTRHCAAVERIAAGQPIRIIDDVTFRRILAE